MFYIVLENNLTARKSILIEYLQFVKQQFGQKWWETISGGSFLALVSEWHWWRRVPSNYFVKDHGAFSDNVNDPEEDIKSFYPVSNLSWIKHLQTKGGHVLRFFFGNAGSFPTTVICFPLCFHSIINIASIPSTAQCLSLLYLWKSVLHFSIVSNVVIFSRGHWSVITLISCEKDVSWVTRSFLEQSRKFCLIWKWHNLRFIMDHSLTPITCYKISL